MFNHLIRIIIIMTIFNSDNIIAMDNGFEDDLALSRKSFLISGVPYNENNKTNGAMTLCFKRVKTNFGLIKYEYDHAALVFEMFFPLSPNDLSVNMIHYSGDADCCGGSSKRPWIIPPKDTLNRVYREYRVNQVTGEKECLPSRYIRYASWILPNKNLVKGYTLASNDCKEHEANSKLLDSYTCVSYVQRIMGEVGLSNLDFGIWIERSNNLKLLVDNYVTPKPSCKKYKKIELPNTEANGKVKFTSLHTPEKEKPKDVLNEAVKKGNNFSELGIDTVEDFEDWTFIDEPQKGCNFRIILANSSLEALSQIKHGELGIFCKKDHLYCKVRNKEEMQIVKSDNPIIGIHSEIFDRILNTLQDRINPEYLQAGVAQEDEKNHGGANHLYNGAFESITLKDEKALFQHISLKGYAPSEFVEIAF